VPAGLACLVERPHDEAVVAIVVGVEEEHVIIAGGEHAAEPVRQLFEGGVADEIARGQRSKG
jgi:hypothetical protein